MYQLFKSRRRLTICFLRWPLLNERALHASIYRHDHCQLLHLQLYKYASNVNVSLSLSTCIDMFLCKHQTRCFQTRVKTIVIVHRVDTALHVGNHEEVIDVSVLTVLPGLTATRNVNITINSY